MSRPWTDEDVLRELYWEKEMSQPDIADELGCSAQTITRWMGKHDIETRDPAKIGKNIDQSVNNTERPWRDEGKFREKYVEKGMGVESMADEWHTSTQTIRRWRDNHDVEPKHSGGYYGGGIPEGSQSAGERVDRYPRLFSDGPYVHQLVALYKGADPEKVFSSGEWHVHHKNEIPWDNRPSNIEVVSRADHIGEHVVQSQ